MASPKPQEDMASPLPQEGMVPPQPQEDIASPTNLHFPCAANTPQQASTSEPQPDHHPYPSRGALQAAVSSLKCGFTKNKLTNVINN
ncbi:hypothetical protein PoB_004581600 [Plakobranchus ocellatus]|uniref:Uncharacterized protein n=1 Tax=Plakobranchus ocellatus TaxID=259542 RepID=A0AAV4BFU7_9GAST|nr:hypothetical protein PoB_004581600 [Plakobranchus ocellatus]